MKSPFHHIRHAQSTFDHFHRNLHHAFVLIVGAIIGMLRGTSNLLIHTTSASRTRGGFITSDFRDQNPSTGNIMYALFGNGSTGDTAYTRLWGSSCVPGNLITSSTGTGGPLLGNTIYVLNPGTYTLSTDVTFLGDCVALIGRGDVTVNMNGHSIVANGRNKIIIDNVKFRGNGSQVGVSLTTTWNTIFHNVDISKNGTGIVLNNNAYLRGDSIRIYDNTIGSDGITGGIYLNNALIYNNTYGTKNLNGVVLNNSQIFNNTYGISAAIGVFNNTIFYNNLNAISASVGALTNNVYLYNNGTGILPAITSIYYYGTLKFFGNIVDTDPSVILTGDGVSLRTTPSSWTLPGQIDTGSVTLSYDRFTNPQNGSGQQLLNGTNRIGLTGIQTFDSTKKPIRYIFGGNILKQNTPVNYSAVSGNSLNEYGIDGADYKTPNYIAEPESSLPYTDQLLVNQYFGSGSVYTQNRATNGCSLSAFLVKHLTGGIFTPSMSKFEDHTIYILTGGEYNTQSISGFVFNGNCIALIGTNSTRFSKANAMPGGIPAVLYANNKRNIIIDNIKVDGNYFNELPVLNNIYKAKAGISFDGASNNNTINDVAVYNNSQYGIYLGLLSHHNTILNTQIFNNGIAGMYLYYSSNYNVINNTQIFNNGTYGIRFANGSSRNTMNNFQAYNNAVGMFGDLTTKENIINRAAIYNNSDVGIYLKNSSGNSINDVKIYNNTIGIRTLYSSPGNKYYGDLKLFGNSGGNFDGTNGNDGYLSPGTAGLFPYAGAMNTGGTMSCMEATNPTLSGTTTKLLNSNCDNMGYTGGFIITPASRYLNYAFGLSIYKQKVPVRYDTGDTLITTPSQYDSGKYIAEFFAIRDNEPEGVNFIGSGAAELNVVYTTNIYTAGVMNIAVPVTLSFDPITTSGYLMISGHVAGTTGIVNNGDTLQISLITRTGFNETVTGTITIGSVTTVFTVRTRSQNTIPTTGSFAFANLSSLPLSIFTGSSTTIAGLETGVFASITFAPIATSGRLEIYSGSTMISSGTSGLYVNNGYQVKAIAQSSSGYAQTVTGYITIGGGTGVFTLMTKGSDSTPPTTPVVTYPLSGEELFFITRQRTAATDTGSGIEGYIYEIAEDVGFIDIVNTGFIANSESGTITGWPSTEFDKTSDTYYRRIKARDRDGNTSSRSTTGSFEAIDSDERDFEPESNANLRTEYDSNEITIEGMKDGLTLRAAIDGDGTLYKNGTDKGTGTLVQNGDELFITIRSSNRYDKTVAAILTIANREVEYKVTTKESDTECTLAPEDEETIQDIFDNMVANYSGSEDRYEEFLYTMQSMLADEIDFTNDCNLQYLEDLINAEIGGGGTGTGVVGTGIHITPSCKEYTITYDEARAAYTSPNFSVITYFANRDALTRYLDSKNPGDCHINTYGVSSRIFTNTDPSKHIAANGKIYSITNDGQGYTSPDFAVAKHFSSISALRSYIDGKNPPPQVRNHQVDTTFTPQEFTAPNAKTYTIYKTNRGYMSYKLLTVRYFGSLAELQSYITRNNPR